MTAKRYPFDTYVTLDIDGKEVILDVVGGTYELGTAGGWDPRAGDCGPGDPPEINFKEVTVDGKPFDLTVQQEQNVMEQLYKKLEDNQL